MWSRTTPFERHDASAGFTLIEVLVALAVVAVSLGAIGAVVAANARAGRWLDQHVALTETARGIVTGLPGRAQLTPGTLSGETAGHRWRVDVLPFLANFVDARLPTPWIPQSVIVRVRSPSGAILEIDTVRLRRREGG